MQRFQKPFSNKMFSYWHAVFKKKKKKEKMSGPKHPPSNEQLYCSISILMSEKQNNVRALIAFFVFVMFYISWAKQYIKWRWKSHFRHFRGVFKGVMTVPQFYIKLRSRLQRRMVLEGSDISAYQMSSV